MDDSRSVDPRESMLRSTLRGAYLIPPFADAALAQGSFTGPGGHPMGLMRNVLLPQGYFPGYTIETLKDVRFYEVGSEQDLQAKWPKLRAAQGDCPLAHGGNNLSEAEDRLSARGSRSQLRGARR